MADALISLLPMLALTAVFYALLCTYRVALRLRGLPDARQTGVLLNIARRAGPPVFVGAAIAVVAIITGRDDAGWLAALFMGGGFGYGLTFALVEMRATTASVTMARGGAALGLALIVIYLGQLL